MSEKVTGKGADISREAPGQISTTPHEPLSRKCLYKEIGPEIMAGTPKSAGKNTKIVQWLPFIERNLPH